LLFRINAVIGYNILRHKVSDAPNNPEQPSKESKEKIDIEALIKTNEDLQEENKNLTVSFQFYMNKGKCLLKLFFILGQS